MDDDNDIESGEEDPSTFRGTENGEEDATTSDKLISVAKQFLCCSGAIISPLAPALISQREYLKQIDYLRVVHYDVMYYAPIVCEGLGAVLSAFSLRLLGRKNSLILINLMHFVPLVMYMSKVEQTYDFMAAMMFHVARRFQAPVVSVYISEVSAPSLRALFIGFCYIIYRIGFYVNEIEVAFSKSLHFLALFSSSVGLIASVLTIESPYWLALNEKHDNARNAYERLRGPDSADSDEALELFEKAEADIPQLRRGLIANIFSAQFGIPLMVITFIYFSDIDLVVLHRDTYNDFILRIHYYDESYSRPFLFGLSRYYTLKYTLPIFGAIAFCLLCMFIGRRILFMGSILVNLSLFAWYLFPSIPLYIVPYSEAFSFTGAKQVPQILAPEIYPGVIRDIGAALSEVILLIFYLIDHMIIYEGKYAQHYVLLKNLRWILIPVGLICTYLYMPETKNLTLVESEEVGREITLP